MDDETLSEKRRSLALLKSGVMTTKAQAGPGPWINTTAKDIRCLEHAIELEEKGIHHILPPLGNRTVKVPVEYWY